MIFNIFKKELKDTLRDKRTIMMMIVIPVLVFPVIMNVFVSISSSFQKEAQEKALKIGYIGSKDHLFSSKIKNCPSFLGEKEIIYFSDSTELSKALQNDSLQLGIVSKGSFAPSENDPFPQLKVDVLYDATEIGMKERAQGYMDFIEREERNKRLDILRIDEDKVTPIKSTYTNVASSKEMIGKLAGGILPYIFIAFGFIGCMYPAIDLFTGEKERGTLETLLTTPVSRLKILIGKMGVVVLSGLLASLSALLGLYLSIEVFQLVKDPELLEVIHSILSPSFLFVLFSLSLPLTIFFAGVMIPIAIYAKTFKEAQSIITPLNIVMVLPAMVGFFPGIELNTTTACIPVVNVVLATKELIAGTLSNGLLALSFAIMVLLAAIAVLVSYKRFDNETNVVN